jgi:hypothetical protein
VTGSRIQIQSVLKRGFLRQLCQGAINTGTSLTQTFLNAAAAINSPTFQKGRIVVHQSGSGQSGSFQAGFSGAQWTQENLFGLLEEFQQILADAQANSILNPPVLPYDDGSPNAAQQLMAAMMADDSLTGVTTQLGDWTGLNVPSLGGVPSA